MINEVQTTTRAEPQAAVLFDEDGFLVDPTLWSEAMGDGIAAHEGLAPLREAHWQVVRHVRSRYLTLGGLPGMRRICRATGLSKEEIHGMFGGCLTLWRIAGLANPGEEAKAYLG